MQNDTPATAEPVTSVNDSPPVRPWRDWVWNYWRDPAKVFDRDGLDVLTRLLFKSLWFFGALYLLFSVAGPTNVNALKLWLSDDVLAEHTGWSFTFMSFLAFAVVRYASEGTPPLLSVNLWVTRLVIPGITTLLGGLVIVGLLYVQLLNAWNYYLHEQRLATSSAVVAIESAGASVDDLRAELRQINETERRTVDSISADLARVAPEKTLTIRTLTQQRQDAIDLAAQERKRVGEALAAARTANVSTRATTSDTRPVDAEMAALFRIDRQMMASLHDLQRSGLVEILLVMGAGLALTSKPRRRKKIEDDEEPAAAAEPPPADTDTDTPADPPPDDNVVTMPKRRHRFYLPAATDEDREAA
jgi:hypothetical protein